MGHKCKLPRQMFVLEMDQCDEEIDLGSGEQEESVQDMHMNDMGTDTPVLSLFALNGLKGAQTIQVTGYCNKKPLQILLDGGSSYNFINSKLV